MDSMVSSWAHRTEEAKAARQAASKSLFTGGLQR
jgi:hypothetical protein